MCYKMLIFTVAVILCCIYAAPAKHTAHSESASTVVSDVQLVLPQLISIEHFEELLKRAGEMFAPVQVLEDVSIVAPAQTKDNIVGPLAPPPFQQMQPPKEQPYNYYLPMFGYEDLKSDTKSRKLERFTPPPESKNKQEPQSNYYAVKSKKLPKKFDAGAKQVNMNWLNVLEKEALGGDDRPQAVYFAHDERNRINFDDSFFAVDTPVQITDNEPHKESKVRTDKVAIDSYLNQGEDLSGEDLVAVAASQLPQINRDFRRQQQQQQQS